jgi:hypothetical protein
LESADRGRHCPWPAFVIWPRPVETGRIQYSRQNRMDTANRATLPDGKGTGFLTHCSVLKVRDRRATTPERSGTTRGGLGADRSC